MKEAHLMQHALEGVVGVFVVAVHGRCHRVLLLGQVVHQFGGGVAQRLVGQRQDYTLSALAYKPQHLGKCLNVR